MDLILTNVQKLYEKLEILPPSGTSDHAIIEWKAKEKNEQKVRPLKVSSLHQFEQYIMQYDWSPVYNAIGANEKTDTLLKLSYEMIQFFFPEKIIKIHG